MTETKCSKLWLAVIVLALVCQSAVGDSVVPLAGNPNALLSGTEAFSAGTLAADVAYAVFAPGVFTDMLGGGFDNAALGGFDAANDFVYAYQIENTGTATISSLQLTLSPGGFFTDLGEDPTADLLGISTSTITPIGLNTAAYIFLSEGDGGNGQILADQASTVLLLSSPQSPGFAEASIINGGLGAEGSLPGPIPLPAAVWMGLTMLGSLGVTEFFRRRVRRGE